jgi:small subunit ribosomal protein S5
VAQARHRGREGGGEGGGGGPGGGGGGGRGPRRDRESDGFESVIQIKRCAAVVKGGRRFSFNAVVVVGDKRGNVGLGYGKAKEVPPAVDKAVKAGNRSLVKVKMNGGTITHPIIGRFGASRVIMLPASAGTGVIAGRGVREVMVAAGITDILTKAMGSTNPINIIKATLDGLNRLRTRDAIAELRGVNF